MGRAWVLKRRWVLKRLESGWAARGFLREERLKGGGRRAGARGCVSGQASSRRPTATSTRESSRAASWAVKASVLGVPCLRNSFADDRQDPSVVQVETPFSSESRSSRDSEGRPCSRNSCADDRAWGGGPGAKKTARTQAHTDASHACSRARARALARTALALALRTQGHATPARHPPSGRHLTPPRQRCAAPTVNINGSIAFTLIWPIPSHNLTHTLPVTCGAVRRRAPSARRVVSTTVGAREGSPS